MKWLTFSLVPVLGQSVKHLGNLAVVFVLVDSTQVSNHQIGHAQSLTPRASDLHICKVDLLALRIPSGSVGLHKWRQFLSQVHHDWCRLPVQSAWGSEPEHITGWICQDQRMRVSSSYLNSFVAIHLASLKVDLARRQLRLKSTMAKLSMDVPSPGVNLAESWLGDGMSETTLNWVDSLTRILETLYELRNVVWIDVTKT